MKKINWHKVAEGAGIVGTIAAIVVGAAAIITNGVALADKVGPKKNNLEQVEVPTQLNEEP